jgi:hypothetical protein
MQEIGKGASNILQERYENCLRPRQYRLKGQDSSESGGYRKGPDVKGQSAHNSLIVGVSVLACSVLSELLARGNKIALATLSTLPLLPTTTTTTTYYCPF